MFKMRKVALECSLMKKHTLKIAKCERSNDDAALQKWLFVELKTIIELRRAEKTRALQQATNSGRIDRVDERARTTRFCFAVCPQHATCAPVVGADSV